MSLQYARRWNIRRCERDQRPSPGRSLPTRRATKHGQDGAQGQRSLRCQIVNATKPTRIGWVVGSRNSILAARLQIASDLGLRNIRAEIDKIRFCRPVPLLE